MEKIPQKPQTNLLTRNCRVFSALNFFLILSIFILVFGNLIGLNLPKYYPILGQWSVAPLKSVSMGFFGAVGFSILLSLPISFLFYLMLPPAEKYLEIRFKTFKNLSTAFVLFGILYFVVKEWKEWGMEKMGQKSSEFFGPELWFFIVVLVLFIVLLKILLILEKKIFD